MSSGNRFSRARSFILSAAISFLSICKFSFVGLTTVGIELKSRRQSSAMNYAGPHISSSFSSAEKNRFRVSDEEGIFSSLGGSDFSSSIYQSSSGEAADPNQGRAEKHCSDKKAHTRPMISNSANLIHCVPLLLSFSIQASRVLIYGGRRWSYRRARRGRNEFMALISGFRLRPEARESSDKLHICIR